MNIKLYRGNIIYTSAPKAFEVVERGYIAVEGGIVKGVYSVLPEELRNVEVVDFGDKLLIPAFNDMHLHAPQYRNTGIAMDLELLPWLENYTFPEESKYKDRGYAEMVYRNLVYDLWKNGTMRASIFGTIHLEATTLLADLFTANGMGAYIGLVAMNRNGSPTLENSVEEAVRDTKQLMGHLDGNDKVRAIVTPRFVPSCTPEMMTALGKLSKEYNLPVQSHLSENVSEIAWVKELEPQSSCYGDAYRRYGLFGETPTLMAHCCYTDGEELQLMKDNDVVCVHCPTSNANLSSGIAPIRKFLDEGIRVMLGSDISGGHHLSMTRVMQYALQVSKLHYALNNHEYPSLVLSEAFYLATKSGGSFFGKVGSFEPGYEFDALLINDSDLNFVKDYTLLERLERYIYLGDDRHIEKRWCCGKEIKEPIH